MQTDTGLQKTFAFGCKISAREFWNYLEIMFFFILFALFTISCYSIFMVCLMRWIWFSLCFIFTAYGFLQPAQAEMFARQQEMLRKQNLARYSIISGVEWSSSNITSCQLILYFTQCLHYGIYNSTTVQVYNVRYTQNHEHIG